MQERLEATTWGRRLISACLVLTVFSLIAANMYPSDLKRIFMKVGKPVVYVTGLDQAWDVFAPNPRQRTAFMEAKIYYADGSVGTWKPPSGGSLFGAYWDYRWRKWFEMMILPAHPEQVLKPAAQWMARTQADPRKQVRAVDLISRFYDLRPPGEHPSRTPWSDAIIYILQGNDVP